MGFVCVACRIAKWELDRTWFPSAPLIVVPVVLNGSQDSIGPKCGILIYILSKSKGQTHTCGGFLTLGVPPNHPKFDHFSIKTYGFVNPPFWETPKCFFFQTCRGYPEGPSTSSTSAAGAHTTSQGPWFFGWHNKVGNRVCLLPLVCMYTANTALNVVYVYIYMYHHTYYI